MARYRKKPVVIEAVQFTNSVSSWGAVEEFCGGDATNTPEGGVVIATLEGPLHASVNDWIIKGIKGEFYPCKPDIFEATYDLVEE